MKNNKKLNILYITVRADHGGGPKHVNDLICNFNNQFNLFVACPDDDPFFLKWKAILGSKNIIKIPHRKLTLKSLFTLLKYCKRNKIEIVHSHGKGAGIYSRLIKIFNPFLRIIHTFHGLQLYNYRWLNNIYFFIEKILALFTSNIICVSKGEQGLLIKNKICSSSKTIVVHNGIEDIIEHFPKQPNHSKAFTITSISRFDYAKNMGKAFEIASAFKGRNDIRFIWIGDGPERLALENKSIAENVQIEFTGFIDKPYKIIGESDIVLSTSLWEGLPYALIEACSLSKPIVATNVIGNNEVVIDGFNGFLFATIEQAVSKVDLLLKSKALKEKMGANARSLFEKQFTIAKMAKNTAMVYLSLTKA